MIFPVHKTLAGRRAVVIGSGPGGLSAAISLAVRGARVIVLEKAPVIGPTFRSVQVGAASFEQTLSPIIDPHILVELFASADQRTTDFVALHRRDPVCRFVFPDQASFDLSHEREQLEERVARLDPHDGKRIIPYLRECRSVASAMQLYRRGRVLLGGKIWSRWRLARMAGEIANPFSFRRKVHKTFRNDRVRAMLLAMRSLSGVSPCAPAAFSEDFLARFHELGGWYVQDGGEAMLTALIRLAELLGVKFATRAVVEKIELEGGRVRRVVGEGFKPLAVSMVVSNSEPFERLGRFLPKLDVMEPLIRRAWKHPKTPSRYVMLAAINQRYDILAPRTVFVSDDATEETRFLDGWKIPPAHPSLSVEVSQPENASSAEASLIIRGISPVSSTRFQWSENQNDEVKERILSLLESRGMVKFRSSIVASEFLPADSHESSNPFATNDPGYDTTSLRRLSRIPHNRVEEIPGLYLASGYTFPGPGFMNELISGMIAAVCASEDAL